MALRYALLGKVLLSTRIREGHNKRLKQTVNLSTTSYTTMGGRARSNAEKHRIKISNQKEGLVHAMKLHEEDKTKDEKDR